MQPLYLVDTNYNSTTHWQLPVIRGAQARATALVRRALHVIAAVVELVAGKGWPAQKQRYSTRNENRGMRTTEKTSGRSE